MFLPGDKEDFKQIKTALDLQRDRSPHIYLVFPALGFCQAYRIFPGIEFMLKIFLSIIPLIELIPTVRLGT